MKAYICNECKRQVEPDTSGCDLLPTGWYVVNRPSAGKTHDLCSAGCLLHYAEREEAEARLRAEVVSDVA